MAASRTRQADQAGTLGAAVPGKVNLGSWGARDYSTSTSQIKFQVHIVRARTATGSAWGRSGPLVASALLVERHRLTPMAATVLMVPLRCPSAVFAAAPAGQGCSRPGDRTRATRGHRRAVHSPGGTHLPTVIVKRKDTPWALPKARVRRIQRGPQANECYSAAQLGQRFVRSFFRCSRTGGWPGGTINHQRSIARLWRIPA
jgi:hypothetical protein